ncbi:redoxin domain-containing protein [Candidatus Fermentibacteria bacterium]|nr:redoxin domain-containing protein [Candidatus Fermentibacteria bacterium]
MAEGDAAPDFTLPDQHKNPLTLSSLRGGRVLLSFHPLAFTPVCTRQMQALEAAHERLASLNTVPLGLSVDAWPAKHAWSREIGLSKLRILSDFWPHGAYAAGLGLFRQAEGFSERANLLLDAEGRVLLLKVYDIPELPDLDEVVSFIEALG